MSNTTQAQLDQQRAETITAVEAVAGDAGDDLVVRVATVRALIYVGDAIRATTPHHLR